MLYKLLWLLFICLALRSWIAFFSSLEAVKVNSFETEQKQAEHQKLSIFFYFKIYSSP